MITRKKLSILIFFFIFCAFPFFIYASELATQYFETGISYYDQGDFEKALEAFKKASEEKPDFAQSYYNMGIIYDQQERFKEAAEAYKKVLEIDPGTGIVLENLALDHYLMGNFKEAMYYAQLAESMGKPINQLLQNQISGEYMKSSKGTLITFSGSGMEPPPALKATLESDIINLEKAIEQKQATGDDLFELGLKYRQIGKLDKAIEILQRALTLDSNNYKIHAELALCYFLNEQQDLFIQYMDSARKLGYTPSVSLSDLRTQTIPKD